MEFLYVGSQFSKLTYIKPINVTSKDIRYSHTCASGNMGLAVILGLQYNPNQAHLEEHEGSLSFVINEKFDVPPIYLYTVPPQGFQRLHPESGRILVTNQEVVCLDKLNVDNPLEFAKMNGVIIVDNTKKPISLVLGS